jgi:methionyl-tRNA synthetase
MSAKKFYLTTPIYYVNARPHIGHAYTTIVADVLARRHRLLGDDTYLLTGTDEHGQKIERSAAAAGVPPQQFADEVAASFEGLWKRMGITYDQFIRTTSDKHKSGAQKLFADLYEKGFIYLDSYTGQYSVGEEMFVEGPPGTIGPDGKPTETVTEENFFFKLSKFQPELIDRIESNDPDYRIIITPESSKNEVLSFLRGKVDARKNPGLAMVVGLTEGLDMIATDSITQSGDTDLDFTEEGSPYIRGALKDLSISRSSFTWGIPVPAAIQSKEKTAQNHVIYVWLDALANYMTALGYGSEDTTLFDKFWPADLHLVGKEITRFHCVYWPAFLLAAGLPLPKQITAHGWLLFDNSKMSKSKGNIVRTETILDAFGDEVYGKQFPESTKAERDLFASDVLRYFLLREIPFGQDGSFSFDSLITRYNADLANGYGNLVSRTLSMIDKYFDRNIPASPVASISTISESTVRATQIFERFVNDKSSGPWLIYLPSEAAALEPAFATSIERFRFTRALEACTELIRMLDSEITFRAPWKIIEGQSSDDIEGKRGEILYIAAESIRIITALLYPILPYATAKVWKQLGVEKSIEQAAADGELKNLQWGGLKPGTKLGPLAPIFPRADKGLIQIMTDMEDAQDSKLASSKLSAQQDPAPPASTHPAAGPRSSTIAEPAGPLPVGGSRALTPGPDPALTTESGQLTPPATAAAPQITIDDFAKVEMRVAQIVVAERIPKADKLLRLEVDLGPHGKRQILSGIAEFYTPEDLVGRRIVVITNLAPRKMRGLESHGMLLAASDTEGGKPALATCGEEIALGARLK